jgi:hypothetical protein
MGKILGEFIGKILEKIFMSHFGHQEKSGENFRNLVAQKYTQNQKVLQKVQQNSLIPIGKTTINNKMVRESNISVSEIIYTEKMYLENFQHAYEVGRNQ